MNQDGKIVNQRANGSEIPINRLTSAGAVNLLTLKGVNSVIGSMEVAEWFMGAMADADIDIVMVIHASPKLSITVAVT